MMFEFPDALMLARIQFAPAVIFALARLTAPPIGFAELSKLVVKPLRSEAIHG